MLEAESEGDARETAAAIPSSALSVPASLHASLMARLDRLGPAKEVAQIGAVIGRESLMLWWLWSRVSRRRNSFGARPSNRCRTVVPARHAAACVVPVQTRTGAGCGLRHSAAGAETRPTRAHRRRPRSKSSSVIEPELLAHHYTEAGRIEEAIDYWLKAGQRAMQRSAHVEAERHLRVGLELLAGLPETTARHHREITLQNTLGVCLMPTRGFGNPRWLRLSPAPLKSARMSTTTEDCSSRCAVRAVSHDSGDMRTASDDAVASLH